METIQGSEPQAPDPGKPYPVTVLGYPAEMIGPKETYERVSDQLTEEPLHHRHQRAWLIAFTIAFMMLMMFGVAVGYLLFKGVGIWGINIPIAWGFAIVNFVWWIGIGHAGTFISAILLLLMQKWRTTINRFTEAMTLFAVMCAGMFPLLHLGRPWIFYFILPYPDTMALWPQFRSPLVWDVFAVSTYFTVSLIFWYIGVMPDLATVRDKAKTKWKQIFYGIGSLGWRGSAMHWKHHQSAYLLLAGLATPLVLSVHSVVSFDFSVAQVPGWHSTIFPPYFVAGAIFSGFAMVLNLIIPIRRIFGFQNLITTRTLNNMACVTLITCWMVAYGYIMEAFMAWYSGDVFDKYMMHDRMFGPYGWIFWVLMTLNVAIPQLLWSRWVRTHDIALWFVALSANVGMWVERFVIVVQSLHRDFLPRSWQMYYPTVWDWATLLGSIGLFLTLLLLFIRYIPMISITESRELIAQRKEGRL
ncbi:MAG TPA: NrfD/PsrC family molybdoenzyme membrane anchor subunit [Verrucomicrobiae bacterium]|jgi:molybdopterin-containing oxidoreductase family membrane subunit|nr:NrfD/PsrC family molybdoenzyme membrane anchor subunit [Verrucomicrobiae bacterium]